MKAISWDDFRVQASRHPARIILADGQEPRVVEAAAMARAQKIAEPILLSPGTPSESDHWVAALMSLSKFKTLTPEEAAERVKDPLVLGCLMLREGRADGFIGGATRTTADTLKAVFSIIGLAPRTSALFGFFLLERQGAVGKNPFVLLADCAVIPDPSAKQLAAIAAGAATAYNFFTGDQARVAFLSFSTHGSAEHPMVEKVRQAVAMSHEKSPALGAQGEWQADTALDPFSARIKGVGESPMAGQANVLIAPDLNTGNIAYKLIQRLGGCRAVGPVLWGTALPANDLSRGCSSQDVLDMIALTTLQASNLHLLEKATHAPR